jgi:hypothetical protein
MPSPLAAASWRPKSRGSVLTGRSQMHGPKPASYRCVTRVALVQQAIFSPSWPDPRRGSLPIEDAPEMAMGDRHLGHLEDQIAAVCDLRADRSAPPSLAGSCATTVGGAVPLVGVLKEAVETFQSGSLSRRRDRAERRSGAASIQSQPRVSRRTVVARRLLEGRSRGFGGSEDCSGMLTLSLSFMPAWSARRRRRS